MPDIPNRDELERKLARQIGRLFRDLGDDWYETLLMYGWDINQIPYDKEKSIELKYLAVLIPFLFESSIQTAEYIATSVPIGVDWAVINQMANEWARSYSVFLAGNIEKTSRSAIAKAIRNTISSYFEEGLSLNEVTRRLESDPTLAKLFTKNVRDKLGRIYGPYRAEMISVTETTRSITEGGRLVADELRRQGINMIERWITARDEYVCPICMPRDGKPEGDGWTKNDGPPAHPRCRCETVFELPKI